MMRSAKYSRSLALTAHLRALQPAPAASKASPSSARLENDCQSTGILLCILDVVGIEDDVVAIVEAQRNAFFEREHHAATHIDHREVADLDRELVGLLA